MGTFSELSDSDVQWLQSEVAHLFDLCKRYFGMPIPQEDVFSGKPLDFQNLGFIYAEEFHLDIGSDIVERGCMCLLALSLWNSKKCVVGIHRIDCDNYEFGARDRNTGQYLALSEAIRLFGWEKEDGLDEEPDLPFKLDKVYKHFCG